MSKKLKYFLMARVKLFAWWLYKKSTPALMIQSRWTLTAKAESLYLHMTELAFLMGETGKSSRAMQEYRTRQFEEFETELKKLLDEKLYFQK